MLHYFGQSRCNGNHPCTKKRTITREPSFLVFHKTGATPTTLSPILRLDKGMSLLLPHVSCISDLEDCSRILLP